jgi:hypothetical protein
VIHGEVPCTQVDSSFVTGATSRVTSPHAVEPGAVFTTAAIAADESGSPRLRIS